MIRLLMSSARKRELQLDHFLMIGRQNLHLNAQELEDCFVEFEYGAVDGNALIHDHNTFAEGVLERIGVAQIDALDASTYEDATIIHDLNLPIPDTYRSSYNVVLDSGTLEHVFNVQEALKSCMKLTKLGGHYIGIFPCNNFFGHGFYQFSSELFYRALSPQNGFKVLDMILFVDEPNTTFYSIADTSVEYPRVQFTNQKPVYIYVVAQKITEKTIFENAPLQMDYAAMKWRGNRPKKVALKNKKKKQLFASTYLKNVIKAILNKRHPNDDARFKKNFLKAYQL